MKGKMNLEALSVILVRPKFHENVGSVARAMKNMGLSRLVIVDGCSPLHRDAYKLSSGAEEILERAEEFPTLEEAVGDLGCVVGMTSRGGGEREPLLEPASLMKRLVPLSHATSIGLVFGSEREGLTNEELSLCHFDARIPSSENFPSLNLAQAVMVIAYEAFRASGPVAAHVPKVASADHLEKMFRHMEETLLKMEFLNRENPKPIMKVLRRLFARSRMDEREVQILRGIWSKVDWILRSEQRQK
jgi:tRNA/rRNA methyltransferase